MKKLSFTLVIITLIISLTGCSLFASAPKDKTFTKSGMSITLTEDFNEKEIVSYTATYESTHVAIFALKEEFNLLAGFEDYTLDEYAGMVIENNGKDCQVEHKDDLTYFTFDYAANGKTYKYLSCVYKGTDAFWLIQFSTVADEYGKYESDIIKWAQSVKV